MDDEMSEESLPPHVMIDSGSEGQQEHGPVDGVSSEPKKSRRRKKGIAVSPKVKKKRVRGKRSKMLAAFYHGSS